MKDWKVAFANSIFNGHKESIVIPFKSVMDELGMKHVARQDAEDIVRYVLENSTRQIGFMYCSDEPFVNGFFSSFKTGVVKIEQIELEFLNAICG